MLPPVKFGFFHGHEVPTYCSSNEELCQYDGGEWSDRFEKKIIVWIQAVMLNVTKN